MRLILILICAFLSVNVSGSIRFTHMFTSHNSPIDTDLGVVGIVAEDKMGFIWLGAKNGLARYDGYTLKVYKKIDANTSSLPGNFVRDIVFDDNDVMWIATSEGLAEYIPETDSFQRFNLNPTHDSEKVSDDIHSIAVDRFNNLIVGTHTGLAIIDNSRTNTYKLYHNPQLDNSLSGNDIRVVYIDSQNNIWIGTNANGVSVLNLETLNIIRYRHDPKKPNSLPGDSIRSFLEDKEGHIWIGTYSSGVSRYSKSRERFSNYLSSKTGHGASSGYAIHHMIQDSQQIIWLATDHGGLAQYNAQEDHFGYIQHNFYDPHSIQSNQVRFIFEDTMKDLWVSTFPGGIDFLDRSSSVFRNFSHDPSNKNSLSNSGVLSFLGDSSGDFWVGTENGLNSFDTEKGDFVRTMHDPKNKDTLRYGTILSMEEDADGSLWVGTWSGGLHHYDKTANTFRNYSAELGNPSSISSEYVWSIFLDSDNTLWAGTELGLNRYNRSNDDFTSFVEDTKNKYAIINNDVRDIIEAPNGDLWVATFGGLERFSKDDEVFHHYQPNKDDSNSIRGIRITDLLEGLDGRIWIATQDGGLNIYSPNENTFQHIGVDDGLPTNQLSGLLEDDQGNIWVSCSFGLIQVDKESLSLRFYTKEHGLVGNNFNRSATYKDQFGNLYFGGTDGISIFHPSQLISPHKESAIQVTGITKLRSKRKSAIDTAQDFTSLLKLEDLTMDYTVASFTLDYTILSYRSPQKNTYAYMLEGFDHDWHYVGVKHNATYTNIPSGDYTFKVKAANRDRLWMSEGASIRLHILPAPWFTGVAYAVYSALAILMILFLWRVQYRRLQLKKEQLAYSKLKSAGRIKSAILVNTSHEFRSPLHNILGISESLIEGVSGDLNKTTENYLKLIVRNGKTLTELIDNISGYADLIDSEEKVISKPVDVYSLVQMVISSYQAVDGVMLINNVPRAAPMILADEERLIQVFKNLVDNALLLTESGEIVIACDEQVGTLKITVSDTGAGMTSEQLANVFNPLVSARLGLAISKYLVELHGGSVRIQSNKGQGTCCTIILPVENV